MIKRTFDFIFSLLGIILLIPLFLLIALWIKLDSKGAVFYRQIRVGRFNKDFSIYKFRTMTEGASNKGLLTVGNRDSRITRSGYYLRKYKLDELAQLINVFLGDMSLVGPRPEVRKYVDLYNNRQMEVLNVRPGITDMASIQFRNENELLKNVPEPEEYYIEKIMPEKLEINLNYLKERNLIKDFNIILLTIFKIFN